VGVGDFVTGKQGLRSIQLDDLVEALCRGSRVGDARVGVRCHEIAPKLGPLRLREIIRVEDAIGVAGNGLDGEGGLAIDIEHGLDGRRQRDGRYDQCCAQ
jgi:hypothetical protein